MGVYDTPDLKELVGKIPKYPFVVLITAEDKDGITFSGSISFFNLELYLKKFSPAIKANDEFEGGCNTKKVYKG